jgi:hypothetical protein
MCDGQKQVLAASQNQGLKQTLQPQDLVRRQFWALAAAIGADQFAFDFSRSRSDWNSTYRGGITKIPNRDAASIPPNTGVLT